MRSASWKPVAWRWSLVMALALVALSGPTALAQDDAAAPKGAMGFAPSEAPAELQKNFQEMVHYYRVARFDLADDFAQLVLSANPEPLQLLKLAEHDEVGMALIDEMTASDDETFRQSAQQVMAIVKRGMFIKRKDGDRIISELKRLDKNQRAFELAKRELLYSGEYAVPYALGLLADQSQADLHDDIKRVILAIDRPAVYPLILGLRTPDRHVKLTVIELLEQLGYKMALPALKALVEAEGTAEEVRQAASQALISIGGPSAANTAARQLYAALAEALYYDRLPVVPDPKEPITDVWAFVEGSGVDYRPAPSNTVNEIMAGHVARRGLEIAPESPELVALWLSIRAQLKVELAAVGPDASSPWDPQNMPTTEFFLRSAGQQYLFDVLDRALRDDNVMVALQAIRALEDVASAGYLGAGVGQGSPLIRALSYPDRLVRFGAAFAVVAIQPKDAFLGSERVTPVLAEAVNLETGPGILILDPNQDNLNRLRGAFRQQGWTVEAATNGNEGISLARGMARIDAVLLSPAIRNVEYVDVIQMLRGDFETAMAPIIILGGAAESVPFGHLEQNQKYIARIPADAAMGQFLSLVEDLQAEAGSVALATEASKQISLRAANTLSFVATADLAFDASAAREALMVAAAGQNEDLAVAAMDALVQMPSTELQQHLAQVAMAEGASETIQVAAFNAIAQMARHVGNGLRSNTVTALIGRVGSEQNDNIRDAIGRVLGALDLDPKLAADYILEYAGQ